MEIQKKYSISDRFEELVLNLCEIDSEVSKGHKIIGLNKLRLMSPLSLLPLAAYIKHKKCILDLSELEEKSRRKLSAIHFPEGARDVKVRARTLPICKVPRNEIRSLESFEKKLLNKVKANANLRNAILYLTSELQNNVWEHSKANNIWIYALTWEKKSRTFCEICIADTGIGIRESYRGTEFETPDDLKAIEQALDGKSSKEERRGYGLTTVSGILIRAFKGKMILMSGDAAMYIYRGTMYPYRLPFEWPGTVAFLQFPIKREVSIFPFLEV